MFAYYAYNTGATQANVLSDIVALLTGTTDKATLSAACDQTNTSIYNTYNNAGWTVHDSAPAATSKMLKAYCQDGTTYKYFGLDFNTTSLLKVGGAETWNNSTHVGTNVINGTTAWASAANPMALACTTSSGVVAIYADQTSIVFYIKTTGTFSFGGCCLEFTRAGTNMGAGLGYPCWGVSYFVNPIILQTPRKKHVSAAGDMTGTSAGTASVLMMPMISASYPLAYASYREAGTEYTVYDTLSTQDIISAHTFSLTALTTLYDYEGKLLLPARLCGIGNELDEMSISSVTYIKLANLFLAQAPFGLWVPKG